MHNVKTEFAAWYIETSEKEHGLICQSDAALFLGIKKQSINTRIKTGSLKTIEYIDENNKKHIYLSLNDIKNEKIKRVIKNEAKKSRNKTENNPE